ncbi:hypothetical protein NL385_26670, partial [Klebsiella pneumoniae]|nr:hypothetical protein [Klebsiella pneumoniae]
LIILVVCTAMTCVTLAYLIDRFLNQLDAGTFVLTPAITLLLVLFAGFVTALMFTLKSLSDREAKTKELKEMQRTETALEAALATLILSYVN